MGSSTTGWSSCRRPPWARSVRPSRGCPASSTPTRTRVIRPPCATSASPTPAASWVATSRGTPMT
eukprot:10825030-Alexandrium_andersonii.AAC.1